MTDKPLEEYFKEKLPQLRREHGYTRKAIATGIGVTLGKYDKLEAGIVPPTIRIISNLARFYGITIDQFLGITPEESQMINSMLLKQFGDKLPAEEKEKIQAAIDAAREARD